MLTPEAMQIFQTVNNSKSFAYLSNFKSEKEKIQLKRFATSQEASKNITVTIKHRETLTEAIKNKYFLIII